MLAQDHNSRRTVTPRYRVKNFPMFFERHFLRRGAKCKHPHPVHVGFAFMDQIPSKSDTRPFANLAVELIVQAMKILPGIPAHGVGLRVNQSLKGTQVGRGQRLASRGKVSASSAVRMNLALRIAASEIRLIVVARCGRILRKPSFDNR